MPKRRKNGNKFTTISVLWKDKERLRKYANFKKDTKNGKLYETDAEVFTKVMNFYGVTQKESSLEGHPTYPTVLQDTHQQD